MTKRLVLAAGAALCLLLPSAAAARVVRFEVEDRKPFAGGVEWGEAGPYERLTGTAYLEVDPRDPLNALIVDLEHAPRNARGRVEFSTPFFILKPLDMARGNHKIYYTVNNRGNDALLNVETAAQVGRNDFALRLGYTIVDAGWQGDLTPVPTRLVPTLPVAAQADGSPIVGLMRVEFSDRSIPVEGAFTFNLKGSPAFRPYETADPNPARARFTVRDSVDGERRPIAANRWAYGRCPTGQDSLTASTTDICYFDGFRADKLYELIYPAKNPLVLGLGHAATRDVAAFLRYELRDEAGNRNPLLQDGASWSIARVYATGASQTGGYLRDFMYLGFNEDEDHRKVFDGVIPTIAGTDRVFINVRFADPNVFASQDDRRDYLQSSYPPFTYGVWTDPLSGIRDGILKRPATDPLVIQFDSSTEFWQLRASLNVVDGAGRTVPLPKTVRLYLQSSTSHGFGAGGLRAPAPVRNARCQNPIPGAVPDVARAALDIMDQWADGGVEPPPSNYPTIAAGTLVTADEARRAFPKGTGAGWPTGPNPYELLDFGPQFGRTGGVMGLQPPLRGAPYPILVPKPNEDGHDLAGVHGMQVRVPLGTTTGWNVRAAGYRAPDLCGLSGSYIPFAETRAERRASRDSRRSLEERYRDHAGYVSAVEAAAKDLVRSRFLHPDDAERYVEAARASDVLKDHRD